MHYLFFGFLSVAVLAIGGVGHRAIEREIAVVQPSSMASGARLGHPDRIENFRKKIVDIAIQEIGVMEATGNNDGKRVEEYLAYAGLGKGYAWCAAFVSWCYGKAGHSVPRNAWSPALFPMARRYTPRQVQQGAIWPADLFGVYNTRLARIDHVGIVREKQGHWILTVEGNVADQVVSKRRAVSAIYAFSNWLD
jgi:hypothetical protein